MTGEQFDFGVHPHAVEILGGLRQFEDIQRAGHLAQQIRHLRQFGMVPGGFDEGIERLTGSGEIGDRFAHQHVEHLARLRAGKILFGIGAVAAGEARDLVVERGVDVEQRTGDIQQGGLIGLAFAIDDVLHHIALLLHERARQPKAEHAEGVCHTLQGFCLRLQRSKVVLGGAQIQIERVFHAQQIFLDRSGDRIEQRAVATGNAAAGVIQLRLGRTQCVQIEHLTQFHQCRVHRFAVRNVIKQLAGGLECGLRTRGIEAALVEHSAGFAINAGKRLAQAKAGSHCAVAQRAGHHRSHPQHPPLRFVAGTGQQRFGCGLKPLAVGRSALLGPCMQRIAQPDEIRCDFMCAGGTGSRSGARQRRGQCAVQVGNEQGAFAQPGFAARGAQLIEQRQQDDRNFLVAALQALKIIRQQHHAAHQRGAGGIAVGHGGVLQRDRQPLHFFGDHRRGVQLDHAQGALHLMQHLCADAHAAGVGRIVGKAFDLDPDHAQGFVELGLDPAQRAVFDRFVERGHRAPPTALARPVSRSGNIRIMSLVLRSDSPVQAGSLKSATERRRSAASCARFPIDSAVWFAPWEVCAVID